MYAFPLSHPETDILISTSDQNNDVYILNLIDVACASIVASMPAYYPMLNNLYKRARDALGLSEVSLPTAPTPYSKNTNPVVSHVSRIIHPKRHAPNPSTNLSSVTGNYYLSRESAEMFGRDGMTTSVRAEGKERDGTLSSKGGNGGITVTDEFEMEEGLAGDRKGARGQAL